MPAIIAPNTAIGWSVARKSSAARATACSARPLPKRSDTNFATRCAVSASSWAGSTGATTRHSCSTRWAMSASAARSRSSPLPQTRTLSPCVSGWPSAPTRRCRSTCPIWRNSSPGTTCRSARGAVRRGSGAASECRPCWWWSRPTRTPSRPRLPQRARWPSPPSRAANQSPPNCVRYCPMPTAAGRSPSARANWSMGWARPAWRWPCSRQRYPSARPPPPTHRSCSTGGTTNRPARCRLKAVRSSGIHISPGSTAYSMLPRAGFSSVKSAHDRWG